MASIIAAWAILWLGIATVVTVTGLRRQRPLVAAVWLISIGGFLALQEDPLLVLQMASSSHSAGFRDGVLGLVDPHTRGHMYGAAIFALGGIGLAVVVAHAALRRGERWAWWSIAGFWLLGTAADVYEVFWIYPHDFPLAADPKRRRARIRLANNRGMDRDLGSRSGYRGTQGDGREDSCAPS